MQRVLTALLLGGAAAFAPLPVAQRTLTLNANPIDIYSAAEDCLQEECSVDTVQMLVGQLKTREQELAKKGRIVGARCPRSDFYASCTPIAAASSFDGARGDGDGSIPAQVDYEREAALAGVRTMIHDLEGPADPNPVVLAVKAAFDLNKANVYVNK